MAAGYIKVTPEKLQSTAAVFETKAGEVQSQTQNMTSIVQALTGQVWSGEAQQAYISKFNGLQDDMNKLYTMVKKHSEELTQIAQEFITAEQKNTDAAGSLVSDTIV